MQFRNGVSLRNLICCLLSSTGGVISYTKRRSPGDDDLQCLSVKFSADAGEIGVIAKGNTSLEMASAVAPTICDDMKDSAFAHGKSYGISLKPR